MRATGFAPRLSTSLPCFPRRLAGARFPASSIEAQHRRQRSPLRRRLESRGFLARASMRHVQRRARDDGSDPNRQSQQPGGVHRSRSPRRTTPMDVAAGTSGQGTVDRERAATGCARAWRHRAGVGSQTPAESSVRLDSPRGRGPWEHCRLRRRGMQVGLFRHRRGRRRSEANSPHPALSREARERRPSLDAWMPRSLPLKTTASAAARTRRGPSGSRRQFDSPRCSTRCNSATPAAWASRRTRACRRC